MKKIILNCDDIGLSIGVNNGVYELYKLGLMKSATALMAANNVGNIHEELIKNDDFSLGIHFNLTYGTPETKCLNHCVVDGQFIKTGVNADFGKEILLEDACDIETEFRAQLDKFIKTFNQIPSHIDSHHHIHRVANVYPVVEKIASELNIKIRGLDNNCETTEIYQAFNEDNYKLENYEQLKSILDRVKDGCDIMMHVANNLDTKDISRYCEGRLIELNLLKDNKDDILSKFEIISYNDVK